MLTTALSIVAVHWREHNAWLITLAPPHREVYPNLPNFNYLPASLLTPLSLSLSPLCLNWLAGIMQFSVITYPDTSKELFAGSFNFKLHLVSQSVQEKGALPLRKESTLRLH